LRREGERKLDAMAIEEESGGELVGETWSGSGGAILLLLLLLLGGLSSSEE